MKTTRLLIFSLAIIVVVAGCVYKEGMQQPDRLSYIWFTGDTDGAVAEVDGGTPFKVELGFYYNNQTDTGKVEKKGKTLYEVKPGRHEIVVKHGDDIRVHRVVLIGKGETKEIKIP